MRTWASASASSPFFPLFFLFFFLLFSIRFTVVLFAILVLVHLVLTFLSCCWRARVLYSPCSPFSSSFFCFWRFVSLAPGIHHPVYASLHAPLSASSIVVPAPPFLCMVSSPFYLSLYTLRSNPARSLACLLPRCV